MPTGNRAEEIEERFQFLESKIAHQESTIEDLNSVVIRQQGQIEDLLAQMKAVRQSVEAAPGGDAPGNEPPPHY